MQTNSIMELANFKPEDKEVKKIFMTYDYNKFKTLEGNRVVNQSNLARITQSMKENHLISPITVNEKLEIIDGQHRFKASKELNLPVYYFIMEGANLQDVQRLNAVSKTWSFVDYMESYCQLGYPEYIKVKRFKQDFPDFSINSNLSLLTLSNAGGNISKKLDYRNGQVSSKTGNFSSGNFKCANLSRSYELAAQIIQLKNLTELYNKSTFVGAFVLVSRKKDFEFKNFKYKLQKFPNKFYDCTNIKNFTAMIEDLYNYRNSNKVNLRF